MRYKDGEEEREGGGRDGRELERGMEGRISERYKGEGEGRRRGGRRDGMGEGKEVERL